ncbi:helix-turn-helix transcriptional regulator [Maricaulis sp.]|uniref:helix-turn-helix transcriptional regulator n=1 Tax=Maricaulis sp. TaxID=1486257 RepID=UPI003A8E7D1C
MNDDDQKRWTIRAGGVLFALIAVFIATDLATDRGEGVSWFHLVLECVALVSAATGALALLVNFQRTRSDLALARAEARRWQDENRALVRGLGAAIVEQFDRWAFTPAESDIGLCLLKGFSHTEIAALRGTSERTVREQARTIYRKSGLSGRTELSAFFLEDLLPAA